MQGMGTVLLIRPYEVFNFPSATSATLSTSPLRERFLGGLVLSADKATEERTLSWVEGYHNYFKL